VSRSSRSETEGVVWGFTQQRERLAREIHVVCEHLAGGVALQMRDFGIQDKIMDVSFSHCFVSIDPRILPSLSACLVEILKFLSSRPALCS
jgi:hypothetical protein